MVDRLILVKSCLDCPLASRIPFDPNKHVLCNKTGRKMENVTKEQGVPDWCPLTYSKPKGFGPVPNKHEIHDTRPGLEC